MESSFTPDIVHMLVFTIPGFFLVKSYTWVRGTKIESDFAYFNYSFFWGLVGLLVSVKFIFTNPLTQLFDNLYATVITLSVLYTFLGCIIGFFTNKNNKADLFLDKIETFIKRKN